MKNIILRRMKERVERSREASDGEYFDELLLLAELLLKLVTSYLVAGLTNGRQRGRYTAEYNLMHAKGLGVWDEVLGNILGGALSTHIVHECSIYAAELSKKITANTSWQYEACEKIEVVLSKLNIKYSEQQKKSLRYWFSLFVLLRNKTKGHGAYRKGVIASICKYFCESLYIIIDNISIINVDCAHLYQSINHKYRVTKITDSCDKFSFVKDKKDNIRSYQDGVYIYYDKLRQINLIDTDQDLSDIFFPNGKVSMNLCEMISYISGDIKRISLDKYSIPPSQLPPSETYGLDGLEVQGNFYGNIPDIKGVYVSRKGLEEEIDSILLDHRNPVITLSGRGGIGKTTTILFVLKKLIESDCRDYEVVLWFSSRDIDLMECGPKPVKMAVSSKEDICNHYIKLMEPDDKFTSGEDKINFFGKELQDTYNGKGKIFVFDNFETLNDPEDVFNWINTYIRLPNKVVITTRFRNFKGDYPIEVKGMSLDETRQLIKKQSRYLGIENVIDSRYADEIYEYSEGHPYIIKVFLGLVASKKEKIGVKSVLSGRDDILNALFERTFNVLTPTAVRVYLTLCKWNSKVPEIAIKAILARPTVAFCNITEAIDELINFSIIEYFESENQRILVCPVASRIFGEKKLKVSPEKFSIEKDVRILMTLGASSEKGKYNFDSRIKSMLTAITNLYKNNKMPSDDFNGIINYISDGYIKGFLIAAQLIEGIDADKSANLYGMFIENSNSEQDDDLKCAWSGIANCAKKNEDGIKYINAKAQLALLLLDTDFCAASDEVYIINKYINLNSDKFNENKEDAKSILNYLAEQMEAKASLARNADAYSRIAWLYIYCGRTKDAIRLANLGLDIDPDNSHCINIKNRFV